MWPDLDIVDRFLCYSLVSNFTCIHPVGTTLIQSDRRIDMTKIIGAFRVYMTVHKNETDQDRMKEGGIEKKIKGSEEKERENEKKNYI